MVTSSVPGMQNPTKSIESLRPFMSFTRDFAKYTVAEGLARMNKQPLRACLRLYSKEAETIIRREKKAGTIVPSGQRGFYRFAAKDKEG